MEGIPVNVSTRIQLIAAVLLVFAGSLLPVGARTLLSDPAQIMNEAYIHLVQGDQSLDAGRLEEAKALYGQAREYYQRLSREFPGYEPRIIQYRKTYCDNQIADIDNRREVVRPAPPVPESEPAPSWSAPVAPALAPMASANASAERSVEVEFLKSRIASLEAELAEYDTLQEEIDSLSAANRLLNQELEQANRHLRSSTQDGRQEAESLRGELTARDEQIRMLQRDLESKRQLDLALNDMEAKVNELNGMVERLHEEIQALHTELDDAEVRADQADLRAQMAEEQLAAVSTTAVPAAPAVPAEPAAAAPPAPKPDRKPAKARPAERKESRPAAPPAPAPPRAAASVPPRPVPDDMSAADFVRQLLQEGENDAALATVQDVRQNAPDDMNLELIEGIALIRLQRYSEAAALLIDIAKRNPRNPEVHATLGAAMMGAGFYDEARETLLMAIRLDKNLPECHYNLAQLYAFIEPINIRQARRHYRSARDLGLAADPQLEKALNP